MTPRDKLREALMDLWRAGFDIGRSDNFVNDDGTEGFANEETYIKARSYHNNKALQAIEAYIKQNYVYVPQVEMVTRWERGGNPEVFMVNGKEVMTEEAATKRFESAIGEDELVDFSHEKEWGEYDLDARANEARNQLRKEARQRWNERQN